MSASLAARFAAGLLWLNGLGFGIPCIIAIRELRAGRGIWTLFGFPTYGHGPFERYGYITTIPLLAGFLVICLAEVAAGVLLWNGYRTGALLALVLVPFGAVYWWGFALPFPWVFAFLRTVFIVVAWRTLT